MWYYIHRRSRNEFSVIIRLKLKTKGKINYFKSLPFLECDKDFADSSGMSTWTINDMMLESWNWESWNWGSVIRINSTCLLMCAICIDESLLLHSAEMDSHCAHDHQRWLESEGENSDVVPCSVYRWHSMHINRLEPEGVFYAWAGRC